MIRPFLSESAARSLSKTNHAFVSQQKYISCHERFMLLLLFKKYSV